MSSTSRRPAPARFAAFTRAELVVLGRSLDDQLRRLDAAQTAVYLRADVNDPRALLTALLRESNLVFVAYLDDLDDLDEALALAAMDQLP